MTTIEDVRFPTPDEIEGFWAFDKMHAPRPLHPLSQDLVMATISRGFTPAQAEYDCPIVASSQAINHYFYMAFHPHPDPAEVDDRMSRYLGMVDKTVPLVGKRWANDWLPLIRTRNEAERDVDYSEMTDAQLFAKYHDMTKWMEEMWYIHGHINFALISGAALSDFYDEVMQPDDPTESYQMLQGYHTRPVDAAHGLWDLSRIAKNSPTLSRIFDENHRRPQAGARGDRGGPRLPGQGRRLPVRLRVALRRRVRPGRRPLARRPADPARQHLPLHPDGRLGRSDDPVQPGGRPA